MPISGIGHYTPGTGRRFVTLNDGTRVTRAAAENLYARSERGGRYGGNYERRQAMASQAFREFKSRPGYEKGFREAQRNRPGLTRQEYDAYTAKLYNEIGASGGWQNVSKSPDGPLSEWLATIGRRNQELIPVGESPSI